MQRRDAGWGTYVDHQMGIRAAERRNGTQHRRQSAPRTEAKSSWEDTAVSNGVTVCVTFQPRLDTVGE